jgi:hypothetical protein
MHKVGESGAIMDKFNCDIIVLYALTAKELGF